MIRKEDVGKAEKDSKNLQDELRAKSYNSIALTFNSIDHGGIEIRVNKVPKEILGLDQIKGLQINFTDEIVIPDEMARIKIEVFKMTGKISDAGIERICKMFPNTVLIINDKQYNKGK